MDKLETMYFRALEAASMDITSAIVNATFILALSMGWVFLHKWTEEVGESGSHDLRNRAFREFKWLISITIFCNAIVPFLYWGFAAYEYWNRRIFCWESAISAMTWILAAGIAFYWRNRMYRGKRWPLILMVWWVFSCFYGFGCSIIYLLAHLKAMEFPHFIPKATIVDFASFTLSFIICCTGLTVNYSKKHNDFEESLLQKENASSFEDDGGFISPGFWSQLTFRWLNPLFKRGRSQKLELAHVPCVPQSETAEYASSLLEESLLRKKIESSSLPKAIVLATWKSLVLTAIFAGTSPSLHYLNSSMLNPFLL